MKHRLLVLGWSCGVKCDVLRDFGFCTKPSCCRFLVGVIYLSFTKGELAVPHRLMSSPDKCIGKRIHVSICDVKKHFIIILMYIVVFIFKLMEVSMK